MTWVDNLTEEQKAEMQEIFNRFLDAVCKLIDVLRDFINWFFDHPEFKEYRRRFNKEQRREKYLRRINFKRS